MVGGRFEFGFFGAFETSLLCNISFRLLGALCLIGALCLVGALCLLVRAAFDRFGPAAIGAAGSLELLARAYDGFCPFQQVSNDAHPAFGGLA